VAFWAYFGIFAALVAAGIGFPIPEEIPVVTAGVMIGHASQDPNSHLRWWIMLPICVAGVVISDGLLYGVGRLWGPRLVEYRWVKNRLLPPERLTQIQCNFQKYGVKILLFARLLPGIRSPIFITAGIMRVPFSRFLVADGIYAIPGVSLLFFLGFWFTDQFLEIVKEVDKVRPLIVVVVLTALVTYLVIRFMRRPVLTGAPEDLPPLVSKVTEQVTHIIHPSKETHHGTMPLPDLNGEETSESEKDVTRETMSAAEQPASSEPPRSNVQS
jgi:membrane protein DedA with SNARE-associated domain